MKRRLVSFDWAIKYLLRDRANFAVLEGLLTVLLKEPIEILDILESEGDKESPDAKLIRLDLRAKTKDGRIILVEVQYQSEFEYLYRMYYYAASTLVSSLKKSQSYGELPKMISINILYFDIGRGDEYVYRGRTKFRGLHHDEPLTLSDYEQKKLGIEEVSEIFTDYYLVLLNRFRKRHPDDALDEWIWMLQQGEVKDDFHAPGLSEAREKLNRMNLSDQQRVMYDRWDMNERREQGILKTAIDTGQDKGREEGHAEGEQVGIAKGERIGIKKGHEEGLAEGEQVGIAKGEQLGIAKGRAEGEQVGIAKGRAEGEQVGIKKGHEEGRAEGEQVGRVEDAIRMIRRNLNDDLIREITQLSAAEIERLRKTHND